MEFEDERNELNGKEGSNEKKVHKVRRYCWLRDPLHRPRGKSSGGRGIMKDDVHYPLLYLPTSRRSASFSGEQRDMERDMERDREGKQRVVRRTNTLLPAGRYCSLLLLLAEAHRVPSSSPLLSALLPATRLLFCAQRTRAWQKRDVSSTATTAKIDTHTGAGRADGCIRSEGLFAADGRRK